MNMVKGEKKNGIAERIPELMCTIIYTVIHSENIYSFQEIKSLQF